MSRTARRKRSTVANRAIAATAALLLGGGGLIAANFYASAGEGWSKDKQPPAQAENAAQQMSTIDCPEVANAITDVPEAARAAVDQELAGIDSQITEAYQKFADQKAQIEQDPTVADNAILNPLKDKRLESFGKISAAITGAGGQQPQGLDALAPCTLRAQAAQDPAASPAPSAAESAPAEGQDAGAGDNGQASPSASAPPAAGQGGNGPDASDFVNIRSVRPNVVKPRKLRQASRGSFITSCGVNKNKKYNSDNVIVAPGVSNGAHHMHDYVGNQGNNAFASDDALAAAATSCRNQGDKSTYYWPVLRLQNGQAEFDVNADGGGKEGNAGKIQTPNEVTLKFVGNPTSKVVAMPRFLRIITGDAKAFVNGNANANASWSCTGFENRQLKDKYPICPRGSKVVRTFNFQSCWDGQNTDSANHRTHVAFADANGRCQNGFKAIPQLQQRIVYRVPPGPGFAVDSFPEQLHKPVTDHGDFINVFDTRIMNKMVSCLNAGTTCR
ncbi:DUF1996 domain-containing protein [Streptomyces sp. SID1121]|uniref:DUF1996 domain-containing protein n=1 Tax=Streptomyces sp. SID1121 TaxID=3425888 RepID=UPI004055B40A